MKKSELKTGMRVTIGRSKYIILLGGAWKYNDADADIMVSIEEASSWNNLSSFTEDLKSVLGFSSIDKVEIPNHPYAISPTMNETNIGYETLWEREKEIMINNHKMSLDIDGKNVTFGCFTFSFDYVLDLFRVLEDSKRHGNKYCNGVIFGGETIRYGDLKLLANHLDNL